MEIGLISALVVMIVIVVFTFVFLRIAAENTGNKIRDNVICQIQTYDSLLEGKASELQRIKNQIEADKIAALKEKKVNKHFDQFQTDIFLPVDVAFRSIDFYSDYRKIKDSFIYDKEKIIHELQHIIEENSNNERYIVLTGLLDKLSFESVYQLSVLNGDEQLEVIREIIATKEKTVLEEFITKEREFNILSFSQWLNVQKECSDTIVKVLIPEKEGDYNFGDGVKTQYDMNLCEGFQIRTGTRLYDYGVRNNELI